jgi:hypothetical protein
MRELIARCFYAERSYLSALDALRDHNAAWTTITNQPGAVSDLNPNTGIGTLTISNDQARQLKTLTDLLYRAVEIGESLNKKARTEKWGIKTPHTRPQRAFAVSCPGRK